MNKSFIILLASVLVFASCNKPVENNPNKHFWGKKQFYSDFLFKQFDASDTAHTYRKTLHFEFNQEAKDSITDAVKFQLVERVVKIGKDGLPKDTLYSPTKDFLLFKNGNQCVDNILEVTTQDGRVDLMIAFVKDSRQEDYTYNLSLQVINNGGLDRIGNIDVSETENIVLTDEWVLEKDYVYNPLGLLLFWGTVAIITLLIVWLIISRIINPKTKFSKLFIDYHDSAGEKRINMGSGYKLLCTDKKVRFSIFSKFFIGVVKVEVHDFWTHPVTITSGRRNVVRLSGHGNYQIENDETIRKEPFTITNSDGQKATITTA
jgi:hypothetical protein